MNKILKTNRMGALALCLLGLATACAASPQAGPRLPGSFPMPAPLPGSGGTSGEETPSAPAELKPFISSGHPELDAWRDSFAARSLAAGRNPEIIHAALSGLRPLPIYLSADLSVAKTGIEDQAEFAKPIWDYVEDAVSEDRKSRGAIKLSDLRSTFDEIERQYGVDRAALTAIWAMETNLGSFIGTNNAANTLANMATEGRRKSFAESELTALMKILERGEATRVELVSGWAGAMGQTQFMPSTFLAYAVDFDGDGKKDLWNNPGDAIASAANYLSASGYQTGQPWGWEVVTGSNFDWSLADGQDRRIASWKAAGIKPLHGPFPIDDFTYANLWLPAGATGPKYLLFKNFDVFKAYNRSDSYAFSVGLLSDGVTGRNGPDTPWPKALPMISKADVETMQAKLNGLGFDAGPVDGIAGRGTRAALQAFQKSRGLVADGYPSKPAFDALMAAAG